MDLVKQSTILASKNIRYSATKYAKILLVSLYITFFFIRRYKTNAFDATLLNKQYTSIRMRYKFICMVSGIIAGIVIL
jgi:hypothetical protein